MAGEVEAKASESQAIVAAPAEAVVVGVHEQSLAEFEANVAAKIARKKVILKQIAANLGPKDVTLYGVGDKQTVHYNGQACRDILGWAGIVIRPERPLLSERIDGPDGPFTVYTAWGSWFYSNDAGNERRTYGNADTRDDFFALRHGDFCVDCGAKIRWDKSNGTNKAICTKENKGVRYERAEYYLPDSEVDHASVQLKALTNLFNHVLRDAGLAPSIDELRSVGFNFAGVKDRVTFGGDKAAQKPQTSSQNPQAQPQEKAAAAARQETPQTAAAATPPKEKAAKGKRAARKPQELDTFAGYISQVWLNDWKKNGQEGRYVKLIQRGQTLLCFHDGPCVTKDGDKNLLDLLNAMRGKYCKFLVKTTGEGSQTKFYIEGALQIGPYGWEGGLPILDRYMTEPKKEGYQATNADVPF